MIGKFALLSLLALAQSKPYKAPSGRLSTYVLCSTDLWHHLIPHEYDCTKFYYCEYGVRRDEPTSCALGTEFSAELQVCIQPALANCQLSGVPPEEEVDNANEGGGNDPEVPESVEQSPDVEEENLVPEESQPETEEQKPEVEEQEPEVVETTPKPVEPQPEPEEQKPEVEEQEPDVVETTQKPVESQPESEEQKQVSEEEKSDVKEVESVPIVPLPESEEQQPEIEEQKPEVEEQESKPPQDWLPNGCPADIHVYWLLPHESECDKFYYCNFGETVLTACAPGTFFNFENQVCDWPKNVNCGNIDSGSGDNSNGNGDNDTENGSSEHGNGTGDNENGTGDNENGTGDNENGTGENENGTGDNESGTGDNENGTGDNENGTGDNEGGNGDSVDGSGDIEDGSGDNGNGIGDSENGIGDSENGSGDSENSGDGWLPNGCPINFDVHHLLPHQTECGKFYQCAHGEKVVGQCEGELQFNPMLQVCDYPENVGCEDANDDENNEENNENSAETNVNTEENSVNSRESSENNGEIDENDESDLAICPSDFSVHLMLPHESDCSKFYYCNFGNKVVQLCPSGLHFHPEIQVCDWPENVNCGNIDSGSGDNSNGNGDNDTENGSSDHENGTGDNENGTGDNENGTGDNENGTGDNENGTGDNENGSGDNEGGSGDSVYGSGDIDDGSGDNGNGIGDSENSGDGWLPNGCPINSDVHHLLPHQTKCGKFYQCVHGVKVVGQCDGELQFNPILQVCDYPENVGCEDADDDENSGENNGHSAETNVNTEENSVNSRESSENNEENDVNDEFHLATCPSDFSVHLLLPHESDCSKFYYCNFGNKVVQLCPSGLHFNPEIQVCDWPWNVNCEI